MGRLSPYEGIIRLTGELMSGLYVYDKAVSFIIAAPGVFLYIIHPICLFTYFITLLVHSVIAYCLDTAAITRANPETGDIMRPSNCDNSTSLLGMLASV